MTLVMSSPSNSIVPPVGSSSRSMVRPAVDLPQPDSPTSPTVSPWRTSREMPSTARTGLSGRVISVFLYWGKCFCMLVRRSSGADPSSVGENGSTRTVGSSIGWVVTRTPYRRGLTTSAKTRARSSVGMRQRAVWPGAASSRPGTMVRQPSSGTR